MSEMISASCTCGQVGFKSTEPPVIQLCCHCNDCRDASGNDYSTIAFFKLESVETSGNLAENIYTAESGSQTKRGFCSSCNALMFDTSAGFPTLIGVMTQRIHAPFALAPTRHVWVSSKLNNVSIPEGCVQHEKGIS